MLKSMTENQYTSFIAQLDGAIIRDQCIMLFMLQCGLRNGEVQSLSWGDICINHEIFFSIEVLNGHSIRKDKRYVTLTPLLREKLGEHRTRCAKTMALDNPSLPVFTTLKGKGKMSARDVQRVAKKHTKAWLGMAFHPHSLRHTFATRLMRHTSIRVVQELLGHKSLQSTQVYTHPSADDKNKAVREAFG